MVESLKLCLMTLFHPIVVTEHIKKQRERKMNWWPVIILLALALMVRVFSIYVTHYPLAAVEVRKANLLLECGKLFVPVLTWVLASYAMTTILDGETLFRETLLFSSYALTPYILFTPILNIASRLMDGNQLGLYVVIEFGILAWVVMLMIIALKEMNGYTVGKTVLMIGLSLFTMVMIWAVVILLYTISSQFVQMVKEMFYEVVYRID
ncbi:MAG: YIP1 family protein [Clostridiales bacterium]|nr:YIP1 family protein [Clostridiales bacterium]